MGTTDRDWAEKSWLHPSEAPQTVATRFADGLALIVACILGAAFGFAILHLA